MHQRAQVWTVFENNVNFLQYSVNTTLMIGDHIHHTKISDGIKVVHELTGHRIETMTVSACYAVFGTLDSTHLKVERFNSFENIPW